MESTPDLAAIMAAKSEDELLAVLTNPGDYLPGAPTVAFSELRKRKLTAEQMRVLQAILEQCEAQSQELCPHCLRPAAFELFTICAHCWQDKNAVRFPCPKCSTTLEAPVKSAGGWIPCSQCGDGAQIPPETAAALLIDAKLDDKAHAAILQRLHAALVQSGLKESDWESTLSELVCMSQERLVNHLRSKNIQVTLARAGARAIEAIGPALRKDVDNAINSNILSGAIVLGLGLLATLMSFSSASRFGGTYLIFSGAIVWGAIQLLIGLGQDGSRRKAQPETNVENYNGPRCVACAAPIQTGLKACPQCGWTQPV